MSLGKLHACRSRSSSGDAGISAKEDKFFVSGRRRLAGCTFRDAYPQSAANSLERVDQWVAGGGSAVDVPAHRAPHGTSRRKVTTSDARPVDVPAHGAPHGTSRRK